LVIAALLARMAAHAAAQAPLTPIPGSPFNFPGGGSSSSAVLLRPGEQQIFVSNQYSNTVTVLNVAANGALSLQDVYSASFGFTFGPYLLSGLAANPAGDRLYVVGTDFNGISYVSVHSVAPDGTLTWLQDAPLPYGSSVFNGVIYVTQPDG